MLRRSLAAPLLLALLACSAEPAPEPSPAPASAPAEAPAPAPAEDLREAGRSVAEALRDRDFAALAERAHPQKGVRFSPYSYVDPDAHRTLSPAELRAAGERIGDGARPQPVPTWGYEDGTGDPIEATIREYFDRYVWDAPYLEEGSVAVDERQGHGNSLDNAAEVYPGARIVEYHIPGRNPDYGGMDWRSLRLVFERDQGDGWQLVGIIHDEWTI